MALDDTLKQLMKQLGAAINESLSESETVSDAMADIRAAGYDVFLILEATIGFHRRDAEAAGEVSPEGLVSGDLVLNSQDTKFLRSLRISLNHPGDPFPDPS